MFPEDNQTPQQRRMNYFYAARNLFDHSPDNAIDVKEVIKTAEAIREFVEAHEVNV